jgi:tetratricopeptide (TPR) repeat protein
MKWISIVLLTAALAAAQATPEHAQALNNEGNRIVETGDYLAAEAPYRESVEIWRSLGPAFEPHLAGTLLNLGVALSGDGRRGEAAKLYAEALALHRHSLGDRHHRTLANMNLLASISLMLGTPELAEALFREALPVERELFPNDIQTARTLAGLSNCLIRHRQFREAIPLAEEALSLAIKAAGEESVDVALAYASVAEAHRSAGNPDRALPLFRKSRALYEKLLGPNHARVSALLSQEGLILMEDHKLSLAEQLMVKAVANLRTYCPRCMVELAIAENNLGLLRLRQKRYRDADTSLSDAVALREKFEIRPGPQLADSLQSLALARQNLRLFDDAARLTTRAQEILSFR